MLLHCCYCCWLLQREEFFLLNWRCGVLCCVVLPLKAFLKACALKYSIMPSQPTIPIDSFIQSFIHAFIHFGLLVWRCLAFSMLVGQRVKRSQLTMVRVYSIKQTSSSTSSSSSLSTFNNVHYYCTFLFSIMCVPCSSKSKCCLLLLSLSSSSSSSVALRVAIMEIQ